MRNKFVLPLALGAALLVAGPLLSDAQARDPYHRHRDRYYNGYGHGPSSGIVLGFNFAPEPVYQPAPVVRYDYSDAVVYDVQRALSRRGYDVGGVDGVIGGKTRDAIRDYQYDRRLRVTGTINESLLRSLGL